MTKYVFSYHSDGEMPSDPAEQEKIMAEWSAWFGSMGDAVVDGGNPFGEIRTVASDGRVTHGGGANPVTGYSIIQADDFDAALGHAKGCPILGGGGSVEVAEAIEM